MLQSGKIVNPRLVPEGSNGTFLVDVVGDSGSCPGIYKPQKGERPLWDFPPGTLYLREYASFLVSREIGWDFVPLTLVRTGPYGPGMLQEFVDADPDNHYFSFRSRPEYRDQLWRIAVFDLFTNNGDRKGSHCLLDDHGKIWGIDHGLTFNVEPKLRTVIWDFCGEPIPQPLLDDIDWLRSCLSQPSTVTEQLGSLLHQTEVTVLRRRLEALLQEPVHPYLHRRWNVPWPWL